MNAGKVCVKRCCLAGANPYLTFHCASQGTILIDLAPDDKEYQSVEEEVCGHASPQNRSLAVCVGNHGLLSDAEHHQRAP